LLFGVQQGQPIFLSWAFGVALGPILPPIQLVPGAHFPRAKQPGPEADHSPPSAAEVWSRTFTDSYAFMVCTGTLPYLTLYTLSMQRIDVTHVTVTVNSSCCCEKH
jgi:hypothetical protein